MREKLPDVSSRYGAPMGRSERHCIGEEGVKFSLQRVRLDSGGYDSGGAYWGFGEPLYWYMSDDGSIEGFTRAASRDNAKSIVRESYPAARFYR